jgi:ankyrin repeat protein
MSFLLHKACNSDNLETLTIQDGEVPFYISGLLSPLEKAKLIFEKYPRIATEERDENGDSPLDIACKFDNIDLIVFLLENGCNPRSHDPQGFKAADKTKRIIVKRIIDLF